MREAYTSILGASELIDGRRIRTTLSGIVFFRPGEMAHQQLAAAHVGPNSITQLKNNSKYT